LKNDEQADELVRLAVAASLSLPTATIQFEPFAAVANDRSLRAREFHTRHEEIPAFQLANVSRELRALLLANRDRIAVNTNSEAWSQQLEAWEKETPTVLPKVEVKKDRITVLDQKLAKQEQDIARERKNLKPTEVDTALKPLNPEWLGKFDDMANKDGSGSCLQAVGVSAYRAR